MRQRALLTTVVALLVFAGGGLLFWLQGSEPTLPEVTVTPAVPASVQSSRLPTPQAQREAAQPATKQLDAAAVPGAHAAFAFRAAVPTGWQAEAVPGIEAVNIYDPAAGGAISQEQSQIFLRHFRANDFLTLSTVQIFSRTSTQVAGRPAVVYDIEKLSSAADFPQQPAWRNARHTVVDVRVSDSNPSEFIVIGKRPDLPQAVFDAFLASLDFEGSGDQSWLVPPVDGFSAAVTLKPFGVFITPETSPVQPDRFTGYHTGADAELPADTPVFSITDGVVLQSGRVGGYGGMVAIEHEINGARVVGIYGHLDPASMVARGVRVARGEMIGRLGQALSDETDGARAHLHFALYRGPGVDVRGYVQQQSELVGWIDPVGYLARSAAK